MILVGKSHGSTSTTEPGAVLWDYLPLMWIRGYGALSCGDAKASTPPSQSLNTLDVLARFAPSPRFV